MSRLISATRYLVIIAVVATLIAATALMVFGAVATATVIEESATRADFTSRGAKMLIVECIVIADIFLLATALYIIAVGLYELFIDDTLPVPTWLAIHTLDDLKDKLVAVVVVVLGVAFLGQFVSWDGQSNLLIPGGAAALVIAALTYFLSQKPRKSRLVKDETLE
jgi:uncharacterized membrane protein YqhA